MEAIAVVAVIRMMTNAVSLTPVWFAGPTNLHAPAKIADCAADAKKIPIAVCQKLSVAEPILVAERVRRWLPLHR